MNKQITTIVASIAAFALAGHAFIYDPSGFSSFDMNHPNDPSINAWGQGYTLGCQYDFPHDSFQEYKFEGETNQTIESVNMCELDGDFQDCDSTFEIYAAPGHTTKSLEIDTTFDVTVPSSLELGDDFYVDGWPELYRNLAFVIGSGDSWVTLECQVET